MNKIPYIPHLTPTTHSEPLGAKRLIVNRQSLIVNYSRFSPLVACLSGAGVMEMA